MKPTVYNKYTKIIGMRTEMQKVESTVVSIAMNFTAGILSTQHHLVATTETL